MLHAKNDYLSLGKSELDFCLLLCLFVWTTGRQGLLIIPPFWIYSIWLSYELPFLKRIFLMYFVKSHLKQRRKHSSQTGFVFTPYWALWLWSSKAFKVSLSLSIIPLKLVAWSMYLNLNTYLSALLDHSQSTQYLTGLNTLFSLTLA